MIRFLLLSILLTILYRAVSRLWSGIVRGMQGHDGTAARPAGAHNRRVPHQGVQMARDPICGTFVVPDHAIALSTSGGERLYFCSPSCRDTYRSRSDAAPSQVHGRTA